MPDVTHLRAEDRKDFASDLDESAREGARRMLAHALETEVANYIARNQERDERGRAQVVRNGKSRARKVTLGSGTIEVRAPRIDDRRRDETGQQRRFRSQILPPYMRRSPKVAEVLPILYLRGLSTGDFREDLAALLGDDASGLSPTAITRLTTVWQEDHEAFQKRDLSERDYVYVWADGVHFRIRLEEDRLCALVMIGVRPDGTKGLTAMKDGYRESTESWASLLRGLKRLHGRAKAALHEIMRAESRKDAEEAIARFEADHEAKYPKAVASLRRDEEQLLTFFGFPAEQRRRRINGAHLIPLVRSGVQFGDGVRSERRSAA